jgi:hypothetical protein
MERTARVLLFAGLVLAPFMAWPGATQALEWIHYGASPSGSMHYFDEAGMTRPSEGIVRVAVRMVFSDEEIRRYLQYRKQGNLPTNGYDKVKYAELLREINCRRKEITTLSVKEFSGDGKLLGTFTTDRSRLPFVPIEPGTMDEHLYRVVCDRVRQ